MLEDSKKENVDEENNYEVNDSGEYYFPKSCYTCKTRFFKRHEFYDRVIFLFVLFTTPILTERKALSTLRRIELEKKKSKSRPERKSSFTYRRESKNWVNFDQFYHNWV